MSSQKPEPIPWSKKMRRLPHTPGVTLAPRLPGDAPEAPGEWMAPDEVVDSVRLNYGTILSWAEEGVMPYGTPGSDFLADFYLSGACLRRFNEAWQARQSARVKLVEVMRSSHDVTVRHFSGTGERCLLIDRQAGRRIATYEAQTGQRIGTQDVGSAIVIALMRYSPRYGRWKLDRIIQEMALDNAPPAVRVLQQARIPRPLGRDS